MIWPSPRCNAAGDVAGELLCLAREPEGAVPVAAVPGGDAETGQGQRLRSGQAGLPGQLQRPAAVIDRLGNPAHG